MRYALGAVGVLMLASCRGDAGRATPSGANARATLVALTQLANHDAALAALIAARPEAFQRDGDGVVSEGWRGAA